MTYGNYSIECSGYGNHAAGISVDFPPEQMVRGNKFDMSGLDLFVTGKSSFDRIGGTPFR